MDNVKYLSLDPGHASGWATFDEKGNGLSVGTVHGKTEVYDLLDEIKPEVVICEDWITKGGKTFGGDKMVTVRIIGAIELWCDQNLVKLHMQPNTVKGIAYKWAGMVPPKNHKLSHETDAYVHGVYFLQKNGVRRPQQGRQINV